MNRGAGRRAAWAAGALAIVPMYPFAAAAEEVAVLGAGPVHLRKRTPRILEDTTAMARIEAGYRLHPRGVARVRIAGLTAEGINLFCDLVAELEIGRGYGVVRGSGFHWRVVQRSGHSAGPGAPMPPQPAPFRRSG
jgi:hypothetical protein